MNIILIVIAAIVGCIALLFIIAIFTKKDYAVERSIVINKPKDHVFAYLKQLSNQSNYNKWWNMDPNAKKYYEGTDGTVGFTAYWDSEMKKAGKGEQEVKKIIEGEHIDYYLRFYRPFKNQARSYISTGVVSANQTQVKWGFKGINPYPSNIMLLLMDMDTVLGGDISESLNNLKNVLENND